MRGGGCVAEQGPLEVLVDNGEIEPRRGDLRPVPDPTILTSRLVNQAVENLRQLVFTRLDGMDNATRLLEQAAQRSPSDTDVKLRNVQAVLEARLDGMDKAIVLLQVSHERIPQHILAEVKHLHDVTAQQFTTMDQRFAGIQTQIHERDDQVKQSAINVKEQITTAMAAQEKLGGEQNKSFTQAAQKSEDAFTKQISALDSKITIITDLVKATMSRDEVTQLFRTVSDKIDGATGLAIRFETLSARVESLSARSMGHREQAQANTQSNQWVVGLAIVIGLAIAGYVFKH
jgi:hypothetical protein